MGSVQIPSEFSDELMQDKSYVVLLVAWCSVSKWDDYVDGNYRQTLPNMQQSRASLVELGKKAFIGTLLCDGFLF